MLAGSWTKLLAEMIVADLYKRTCCRCGQTFYDSDEEERTCPKCWEKLADALSHVPMQKGVVN